MCVCVCSCRVDDGEVAERSSRDGEAAMFHSFFFPVSLFFLLVSIVGNVLCLRFHRVGASFSLNRSDLVFCACCCVDEVRSLLSVSVFSLCDFLLVCIVLFGSITV